jgi:hypothetical protein
MSRSKDFWEGSETNQSPGNGPVWAAADICDSLACLRKSRSRPTGVLVSVQSDSAAGLVGL